MHAIEFRKNEYTGGDGKPHYELETIDGDSEGMGNTTWQALKQFFATLGVHPDAWPEFPNHQLSIDIPIPEVDAKNEVLRKALRENRSAIEAADMPERYRKILAYIERGERIFFTPV